MADILDDLRKVRRLRGDTYSSAEVVGFIGKAADEIERLRNALAQERQNYKLLARERIG